MLASEEMSHADAVRSTEDHVVSNAANMHALLACIEICLGEELRPYREVEEELAAHPAMLRTMQTPDTILTILVRSGAVYSKAIEAEGTDDDSAEPVESETAESTYEAEAQTAVADEQSDASAEEADEEQPVDFLVRATEAGAEVLDEFAVERRYGILLATEPENYAHVYEAVLEMCTGAGASKDDIEQAIEHDPAMNDPKQVFPGYFISKLEHVGALMWDGRWKNTLAA